MDAGADSDRSVPYILPEFPMVCEIQIPIRVRHISSVLLDLGDSIQCYGSNLPLQSGQDQRPTRHDRPYVHDKPLLEQGYPWDGNYCQRPS